MRKRRIYKYNKNSVLYPSDFTTAAQWEIEDEQSQRHDVNSSIDVGEMVIVRMPWEIDETDSKVDSVNDPGVSVSFFSFRHFRYYIDP